MSISSSLVRESCEPKQGPKLPAPNPGSHLKYRTRAVVNKADAADWRAHRKVAVATSALDGS